MAKDPARNQPNYKIDGGQLNQYEFAQQHEALSKQEQDRFLRDETERRVRAAEAARAAAADDNDTEPQADAADELAAEAESAAAMNADVPQPPDAARTTEGQPS